MLKHTCRERETAVRERPAIGQRKTCANLDLHTMCIIHDTSFFPNRKTDFRERAAKGRR